MHGYEEVVFSEHFDYRFFGNMRAFCFLCFERETENGSIAIESRPKYSKKRDGA